MDCKCGCGLQIQHKRHHKWKPAQYISGHNTRDREIIGWRLNHGYKQSTINWKYEHVQIMESHIGRKIYKNEVVHHINGDKLDNRLENLQLMTISEHVTYHDKEKPRNRMGQFVSIAP